MNGQNIESSKVNDPLELCFSIKVDEKAILEKYFQH